LNVDKLALRDLVDLQQRVQKAISVAKDRERAELKQKISQMAETSGFSVTELFGGRGASSRGKSTGVARFRNPDNPAETWTGRGRKPNWLLTRLANGESMEDFAI
jgi:DNA-binding protein H-NS